MMRVLELLQAGTASTAFWTLLNWPQPFKSTVKTNATLYVFISLDFHLVGSHIRFLRRCWYTNNFSMPIWSKILSRKAGFKGLRGRITVVEAVVEGREMLWRAMMRERNAMAKAESQKKISLAFAFMALCSFVCFLRKVVGFVVVGVRRSEVCTMQYTSPLYILRWVMIWRGR